MSHNTALLVARLSLALTFAVAGFAKLADREGSQWAMIDFGAPRSVAGVLGISLPFVELAVAGTLIPTSTALWGAMGALALLLLFVLGIGINLAWGNKPTCHCFGQLHSAPAGWKTLARNGILAVLAAFLVWQGWQGNAGPSAIAWIGTLTTFQLLALIGGLVFLGLLASQWWFLLHLLRQNGRLLVRLEAIESTVATGGRIAPSQNGKTALPQEGLPVGTRAPSFTLEGLYGETLTLDSLRSSGKLVMLLFTDPSCGPCNALLPEIEGWQQEHSEKITLALISRGNLKENKAKTSGHGLTKVLLQKDWEVSEAYEVRGTPSALVVRPDGTIGSPVVGGVEAIRSLVQQAGEGLSLNAPLLPGAPAPAHKGNGGPCPNCGKKHPAEGVPARPQTIGIGEETPEVKLEDLSGKEIDLKNDFKGEETLVLFWNPGCGFCQQMLPDLKEWEENPPKGAPNLLVISAGTKEANAVMGLSSPVVLDQQFYVGRSFGVDGTPSAVLVDEDGRIASEAAVGGPAVLELASARRVGP